MDRKAKRSTISLTACPYEAYRGTPTWNIVEKAIDDLVENEDLVETTGRDYIVGYICKKLKRVLPKVGA